MFRSLSRALLPALLLALHPASQAQLAAPPTEAELQSQGAVQVRGEDLSKLLTNATIDHTNLQSGQNVLMFYRDDGRRFIRLGSSVRDTKWWIKDDLRCEASVAGTGNVCQKVFRQGDVYRICTAGDPACYWMATFTPGDIAQLAR